MSLARVKVWNPGDVLTASDLNGEFNNVINNPISLISPSTGAINFALQAHTNLIPGAISASSATAGHALVAVGGATVWSTPTVASSAVSIVAGSTGQVFAVTSSNSAPAFQVLPVDGGLSSGTPSTGAVYYLSTNHKFLPLTIGSSGQVLTVSTALLPSWATPAASGGGGGGFSSTSFSMFDEFTHVTGAGSAIFLGDHWYASNDSINILGLSSMPNGIVAFPTGAATAHMVTVNSSIGAFLRPFQSTLNPDMTIVYMPNSTSTAAIHRLGMIASTLISGDINDGIYFRISGSSTVVGVCRSGAVETAVNTTAVATSSALMRLRAAVTGDGTIVQFYTDGNAHSTTVTTNISTAIFGFGVGTVGGAASSALRLDGWSITQDRYLGQL